MLSFGFKRITYHCLLGLFFVVMAEKFIHSTVKWVAGLLPNCAVKGFRHSTHWMLSLFSLCRKEDSAWLFEREFDVVSLVHYTKPPCTFLVEEDWWWWLWRDL